MNTPAEKTNYGLSGGIYRFLLSGLPAEFRARFGADMVADFHQLSIERGWIKAWYLVLSDLPASIFREHLGTSPTRPNHQKGSTLEMTFQDIRYAFRGLIKTPAFTATALLTLALGIGANTAIFSVVDLVLLDPLPYENPEQLVRLYHRYPSLDLTAAVSVPGFLDYRDHAEVFDSLSVYSGWSANLTGVDQPERLPGQLVSWSFFRTLGIEPVLGRDFMEEEDEPGNDKVLLLGNGFWKRRFGADPEVVGSNLTINGNSYVVVGVLPEDLWLPAGVPDVVSPIAFSQAARDPSRRGSEYLAVIGRIKSSTTVSQAQSAMDTLSARLRERYYSDIGFGEWHVRLVPLQEQVVGDVRPALLMLLGTVGFVLLIACANVANLLLVRSATRRREIAVRTAIGAGRSRLIRLFLSETLILSLAGGLIGFWLARVGIGLLPDFAVQNIPRLQTLTLDTRILTLTLGLSVITGIVFGLAPIFQSSGIGLVEGLKDNSKSAGSGRKLTRLRGVLVISEVALALVLLVGSALMIKSFVRLQGVDAGFRPAGLLKMNVSLPPGRYDTEEPIMAFYDGLRERIAAIPGVESVAGTNMIPLAGGRSQASFRINDGSTEIDVSELHGDRRVITPDYFRTMGIAMLRGRGFSARDGADQTLVTVVNEHLAETLFPGENPIGQRLSYYETDEPIWREIVGVVTNVRHGGLDDENKFQIYLPHAQRVGRGMSLAIRSSLPPASLVPSLRAAVAELDPDQPIWGVQPMEELVAVSMADRRFSMAMLVIFAGLALVLAMIGVYGVISYSVAERTHEIGVRVALGAGRKSVFRLIIGQGMLLAGLGTIVGIAGALALTRLMDQMLFEVSPTDTWSFVSIAALLTAVSFLASYIPARRAIGVDPLDALRHE